MRLKFIGKEVKFKMPNRIIKESICTSERIAELSDFEFRLWVGLITQADDAGRCDARPEVIQGRVFPLIRNKVKIQKIQNALHALEDKGCITLYDVAGKPYLYFPHWSDHQRIRCSKPKYPAPDSAYCCNLPQSAAECGQNPSQSDPIQSINNYDYNYNLLSLSTRACAQESMPPTVAQVASYFEEMCGLESKTTALAEAKLFVAYNAKRKWDCLPEWELAANLWIERIDRNK